MPFVNRLDSWNFGFGIIGYRVRREVQPRDVEVSGDITGDRELEKPEQIVPSDSEDIDSVKQFSLVSVMAATNNFSDENKLGKGGFGPVYKVIN